MAPLACTANFVNVVSRRFVDRDGGPYRIERGRCNHPVKLLATPPGGCARNPTTLSRIAMQKSARVQALRISPTMFFRGGTGTQYAKLIGTASANRRHYDDPLGALKKDEFERFGYSAISTA